MQLLQMPGTCTDGILVLLEEVGLPYTTRLIDFAKGAQQSPEFLAINPKGKVPVLVLDDGTVLTQWLAIATYLASLRPELELLPTSGLAMAQTLEVVDYITATAHMLGFSRIVRPEKFAEREEDFERASQRGHRLAKESLDVLDRSLDGRRFAAGEAFSIADAALFFIEHWSAALLGYELPSNCGAHYALMLERPSVQRLLAAQ